MLQIFPTSCCNPLNNDYRGRISEAFVFFNIIHMYDLSKNLVKVFMKCYNVACKLREYS